MPGQYTVPVRNAGTLITALIYNGDHLDQVDGRNALFAGSYSTSASQILTTADPFPGGVESLAPSLAGEVARLRFDISEMKSLLSGGQLAPWYDGLLGAGFATIGARVVRPTPLNVLNATQTAIDFSGAVTNFNSGVWNSGLNPTRFTAPVTGIYLCAAGVRWDTAGFGALGLRQLQVTVNGSFLGLPTVTNTVAGSGTVRTHQAVTGILQMTAGDYVEYVVFQDSGITQQVSANGQQSLMGALALLGT